MKDKIKSLCKSKNIPVYKMEEELGFSKGYISKLNDSKPSFERVVRIANYLQVDVKELL